MATLASFEPMAAPLVMATPTVRAASVAIEASAQLLAVPQAAQPAATANPDTPPAETREAQWDNKRAAGIVNSAVRSDTPRARSDANGVRSTRSADGPRATATPSRRPAAVNADRHATNEQDLEPGLSLSASHQEWTREAIVTELASWMLGDEAVRESFVERFGPPGSVAAACRVFGDFRAALAVAAGHVARLYPGTPAPAR